MAAMMLITINFNNGFAIKIYCHQHHCMAAILISQLLKGHMFLYSLNFFAWTLFSCNV